MESGRLIFGVMMANLMLDFSDLYTEVEKYLGTYASGSPSVADLADAKFIVNRAYARMLSYTDWEFTKQYGKIITVDGVWKYALPADFSFFITRVLEYDSDDSYDPVTECSTGMILDYRAKSTYSGYPLQFALNNLTYNKQVGGGWEVWLDPVPDAAYILTYQYKVMPQKLENDDDIPMGGVELSDSMLEMCLAYAEAYKEGEPGVHTSIISAIMQGALGLDSKRKPTNLGREDTSRGSGRGSNILGSTLTFDNGSTL